MAVPQGGVEGRIDPESPGERRRKRLDRLIDRWNDLDDFLKSPPTVPGVTGAPVKVPKSQIEAAKRERARIADQVNALVERHPNLADEARDQGFPTGVGLPSGHGWEGAGTGKPKDKDKDKPKGTGVVDGIQGAHAGTTGTDPVAGAVDRTDDLLKKQPTGTGQRLGKRERLKHFKLVRLPSGRVAAIRTLNIRGNKVQWGVWVDKGDFDLYGVDPKDISTLTKAQAKKLEIMGNADELVFRGDDRNDFKAIVRGITRAHKGSPLLEDDEILGIIVAQSALNFNDNETQGLLKKTKWYRTSTDHEQLWNLDYSPEQRRETTRNIRAQIIDKLEDAYGTEWERHIDNPMKQVRKWAEAIASGELGGDPTAGMNRWFGNQLDKAAEIEGTPAWITRQQEQEADRAFMNRPEDQFEILRAQAEAYFGPKMRPDRATLMQWATDMVTEKKSEGDWAQYLRQQSKALMPWKDPDTPWQQVASPYKSILEDIMASPIEWDHKLLTRIGGDKGPITAHEFEMMARDPDLNPEAYQRGTKLFDDGMDMLAQILQTMRGVTV